jgi:flagellar basal-body rod modification protein FlgD
MLSQMQIETEKHKYDINPRQTGTTDISPNAFLQLLMTQLKYQDPTNPLGNAEFISQQAQFTQISELQKLNKTISNSNQLMQSSSLIGKLVSLTDPENPQNTIQGKVTEARINSNGASVVINGEKAYPISSIIGIKDTE